MAKINVILISSVRPEPTSGGQLVLHRHLVGQADLEVAIYGQEALKVTPSAVFRRIFGRIRRTRLNRLAEDFLALSTGRWIDGMLPRQVEPGQNTVVVTVAHGEAAMSAWRFAKKQCLPLVTFFHDWWPDIPNVHGPVRHRLEKNFRKLYRGSTVNLCVCEGMMARLGQHSGATVHYPIPQKANGDCSQSRLGAHPAPFLGLRCAGNLFEYGPMLAEALKELAKQQHIRLQVRGANPNWPADFRESMRLQGWWQDFAPRNEIKDWLAEADAFLIPMVFDGHLRRRMETSFPSKLIEFAQLKKPLVIWGPDYCSAVKWARHGDRALCVTDPNPAALRQALEGLASAPEEMQRLAAAARLAAETEFNPEYLQARFMDVLSRAARSGNN